MRKKLIICTLFLTLILLLVPACDMQHASGSIKSITKPYIAEYECTEARLGETDLLEKYDYIVFSLLDKEKLEVNYKPKDGKQKSVEGTYSLNTETRELTAESGLLGYRFKDTVKIENGKFTLSKKIGSKQLVMKFKVK